MTVAADLYEFSIWADGYATDADGNRLDAQGNIIEQPPEPHTETEDPQEEP